MARSSALLDQRGTRPLGRQPAPPAQYRTYTTKRAPQQKQARVLIHQLKLPSFLALNASHCAIGLLHVAGSIQRYLDGKTPRPPTSNDLNARDGLATGPMPDGLKAIFPESHVVYADCLGFHHAGRTRAKRRGLCARCAVEQVERERRSQPAAAKSPACGGVKASEAPWGAACCLGRRTSNLRGRKSARDRALDSPKKFNCRRKGDAARLRPPVGHAPGHTSQQGWRPTGQLMLPANGWVVPFVSNIAGMRLEWQRHCRFAANAHLDRRRKGQPSMMTRCTAPSISCWSDRRPCASICFNNSPKRRGIARPRARTIT
jgi:hypothetical protein